MFENLNFRSKLLVVAAVPVNFLTLLGLWSGAVAGEPVLAVFAIVGAVATMIVAYLVVQRVMAQVAMVDEAAQQLATKQLPELFARFDSLTVAPAVTATDSAEGTHSTTASEAEGKPDMYWPDDELSAVLEAIAAVPTRLTQLIVEQRDRTSTQLSGIVQNLSRRQQSLLDRQIDYIDWLEDTEQKPDRLQQLFKLDHLATRLRRSSESVLVLAGADPTRPRGGPAPIATVLRVAMGETEAYAKIKLRSIDQTMVAPGPAFDLAHLLSELLENATRFSPPDAPVDIFAVQLGDGSYKITIVDAGVGMDQAALSGANATLANPPDLQLSQGRTIGLIVAGRLAAKLGATVELANTPGSGVTATVTVPATALQNARASAGTTLADMIGPKSAPPKRTRPKTTRPKTTRPKTKQATNAPGRTNTPVKPDSANEQAKEPAPADDGRPKPVRRRVTEDSSHALSKLLGLGHEASGLVESNEWAVPLVEGDEKAKPLAARSEPDRPRDGKSDSKDDVTEMLTAQAEPEMAQPETAEPGTAQQKRPQARRSKSRRAAKTLDAALPSGAKFELGLENLLAGVHDDGPTERPAPTPETPATADEGALAAPSDNERHSGGEPPEPESGAEAKLESGPTAGADTEEPWVAPAAPAPAGSLARRERGANVIPTTSGPRVKASNRKPEEIRSMISRYRDGLKGSIDDQTEGSAETHAGDDNSGNDAKDAVDKQAKHRKDSK